MCCICGIIFDKHTLCSVNHENGDLRLTSVYLEKLPKEEECRVQHLIDSIVGVDGPLGMDN